MESIMACIDKYRLNVSGYSDGFRRDDQRRELLIRDAVELAKKSDVVLLCMGLEEIMESEGQDRVHMRLHEKQTHLLEALYEVNKNIIVYLSGGSAVLMPWLDKCKAVLQGYLGGQAGSSALLRILTGAVNPSGKLAETFWLNQEDVPSDPFWQKKQRTSEYREGVYVGYRAYTTTHRPVQFPFGFGLSYTSFAYANIDADKEGVAFTLTNTGSRSGREIAQLYVGKKDSVIFRPVKELKGFASVELEPGQSKRVSIDFDDKAFRYFDVNKNDWVIEDGTYQIMIGANVSEIRLMCEVEIEGLKIESPYNQDQISHYLSGAVESVNEFEFECLLGRAVPTGDWDEKAPLEMNDALSQMYYARSWIARLVYRGLIGWFNRSKRKREPDLNILFIYHITFRGIAKMLGGVIGMEMARGILYIANGEVSRGLRKLAKGFEIRRRYRRFKNK
jgi:beta-glucosidase